MCCFLNIDINECKNLHYIPEILECYKKYSKYLHDDFTTNDGMEYILSSVPYLWVICDRNKNFMGFASLDNFIGNKTLKFCADVTTCFTQKAWGSFTKYSAKFFLKKCFDELGLYKIRAEIFPDNYRVKTLLKSAGFKYEATLPEETLRKGKLQDIEIYSVKRNYYYKNEVNYYD